jgi:hypothetical protein
MFTPNFEAPDNKKPSSTPDSNGQYELEFAPEPEKSDRRPDKPSISPRQEEASKQEELNKTDDPFDWVGREKNRRAKLAAEQAEEEKKKKIAQAADQERVQLEEEQRENAEDIINTYRRF